jgi:hypothetical protein
LKNKLGVRVFVSMYGSPVLHLDSFMVDYRRTVLVDSRRCSTRDTAIIVANRFDDPDIFFNKSMSPSVYISVYRALVGRTKSRVIPVARLELSSAHR